MRVLLIAQFYPPLMGGIERHVHSLAHGLAGRGHEVTVATLAHQDLAAVQKDGPVMVHRLRGSLQRVGSLFTSDRRHAPPFPDPEVMFGLRRLVERVQPDIVHAHNWMTHSFLPLKALGHARLVRTLHDSSLVCAQMRMVYSDGSLCSGPGARCTPCTTRHYGTVKGAVTLHALRAMAHLERRQVDMFVAVSSAIAHANRLADRSLPHRVIPNFIPDGVEDTPADLDPRVQALPEGCLLMVGDLSADKGVHVLLAAYARLREPPPLVLIGRRVADSPDTLPAGVTVIDGLPHASVMQAWRRCRFGIVASTCLDASPTVTLEALACGKPVIGSAIGGIPDQIEEGVNGLLVPPGDVVALAAAMQRLLDDPEGCERMGHAAHAKVAPFRSSAVIQRIETLYQDLRTPASANPDHAHRPTRSPGAVAPP